MRHADKRQAFWPEKSVRGIPLEVLEQMQKRRCSLQAEAFASGESLAVPLSKAPLCCGREHLSSRDPVTWKLAVSPRARGSVPYHVYIACERFLTGEVRLNATTKKGEA